MRLTLALALALAFAGCGEVFSVDDVARLEVEAEVPVAVHLPPSPSPPLPAPEVRGFTVAVPIDFEQVLREQGRDADADRLLEHADSVEAVVLRKIEYEVPEPNDLVASLSAIELYMAPFETRSPGVNARSLGRTLRIPALRSLATRELDYAGTALADGSEMMSALRFSLIAVGTLDIPKDRAIVAQALTLRLRMKVRLRVNLAK